MVPSPFWFKPNEVLHGPVLPYSTASLTMPTTVVSTAIAPDKLADYQEPPSLLRSELSGLVAVSFIFLLTTWTTVGLRMYVRTCLVKAVGADDWFMVVTLVSLPLLRRPSPSPYPLQLFFSAYSIACCILSFDILASVTEYAAGQIPTTSTLPNVRPPCSPVQPPIDEPPRPS